MKLLQALHLMAAVLSPAAPHTYDAGQVMAEIANVVEAAPKPVFATKEQDAAVLLVTAWEEGRFKKNVVGDSGRALCTYQLQHARGPF